MRWPLTPFGTPLLLLLGLPLAGLTCWAVSERSLWAVLPGAVLTFLIQFFRDPERHGEGGEDELLSPADGVVADILELDDADLGEPCVRVGVFLNVVNVHVNRVPCSAEVTAVNWREGGYLDARDPRCIEENRAATIVLKRPDGRRLGVRQITGLIARRIICPVKPGERFERGERYGMIRFGSRTELLIPKTELGELLVTTGQRVFGGQTLLARLRPGGGDG